MTLEAFDIERLLAQQNRYDAQHGTDEYRLKPSLERELDDTIEQAPLYSRLSPAGQRVIRAIHSTPNLYAESERIGRANLEFYLGRSGASAKHVFNRFKYRLQERGHTGGMVICRCDTKVAPRWEGVAVRIIKQLQQRGRLCVANVAAHGGGGMPWTKESVVYLTWRVLDRRQSISAATKDDVDEVTFAVADQCSEVSETTIWNVVDLVTRPKREIAALDWCSADEAA